MSKEEPPLGRYEAQDIDQLVDRLLRDLGRPEPPLDLDQVRALQRLDLTYYSKTDLDLLDEMAHRARIAGNVILSTAKRMVELTEDGRALDADLLAIGRYDRQAARARSHRLLPCGVLDTVGPPVATSIRRATARNLQADWLDGTQPPWTPAVQHWLAAQGAAAAASG